MGWSISIVQDHSGSLASFFKTKGIHVPLLSNCSFIFQRYSNVDLPKNRQYFFLPLCPFLILSATLRKGPIVVVVFSFRLIAISPAFVTCHYVNHDYWIFEAPIHAAAFLIFIQIIRNTFRTKFSDSRVLLQNCLNFTHTTKMGPAYNVTKMDTISYKCNESIIGHGNRYGFITIC